MVDKSVVDWIRDEKRQGYSDEDLMQALLSQGYSKTDIDDAFLAHKEHAHLNFYQLINHHGPLFALLFYIFLILFTVPMIIEIIAAIKHDKHIFMVFALVWLGVLSLLIILKKLYPALVMMFVQYPICFLALPLLPFAGHQIKHSTTYLLIAFISIVIGTAMAFLFDKITDFKKFVSSAVTFSSLFAMVFTLINVAEKLMNTLIDALTNLQKELPLIKSKEINIGDVDIISATVGFILAMLFFNAPYIIFYMKREDRNPKMFLPYLIPILTYVLMPLLLNYITNQIITSATQAGEQAISNLTDKFLGGLLG